jgi:hypothetical protein
VTLSFPDVTIVSPFFISAGPPAGSKVLSLVAGELSVPVFQKNLRAKFLFYHFFDFFGLKTFRNVIKSSFVELFDLVN